MRRRVSWRCAPPEERERRSGEGMQEDACLTLHLLSSHSAHHGLLKLWTVNVPMLLSRSLSRGFVFLYRSNSVKGLICLGTASPAASGEGSSLLSEASLFVSLSVSLLVYQ
ncbi:hypothetical protein DQ04_03261060 [Trypanosoma grayi]|uniref:hypothetical protein n=1 Tax=Trypanosoma grayi TaxID=71804 RepID=UPI0004F445A2|nr:hypothetical protein DQ04_03261060 [Trypanosoma grayi]KEG10820.1 hypothetical protein DQ04_03261060 [Trypanosoma grayi]